MFDHDSRHGAGSRLELQPQLFQGIEQRDGCGAIRHGGDVGRLAHPIQPEVIEALEAGGIHDGPADIVAGDIGQQLDQIGHAEIAAGTVIETWVTLDARTVRRLRMRGLLELRPLRTHRQQIHG